MPTLPVLVIGHSRPDLTRQVIEAVEKYQPSKLYLACDGPRSSLLADHEKVKGVREVMRSALVDGPIFTRFEETNQGLQDGVVNAIDWFFDHEEEGIILEDDCVPTADFFNFCEIMLTRYRDKPQVWGAGGYNPTEISFSSGSYGFIRFAMVWGWASWANRWKLYDRDLEKFRAEALHGDFTWPSEGLYHGLDWHLKRQLRNPTTWDYQWSWTVASHGGLWAMPAQNTIVNIGFGREATNTRKVMFGNQETKRLAHVEHPREIGVEEESEELFLRRHLRVYPSSWLNLLRNAARRLRVICESSARKLKLS